MVSSCEVLAMRAPSNESARSVMTLVCPLKGAPTVSSVAASNSQIVVRGPSVIELNTAKMVSLFVQNTGANE
jgi:hypothetical protein